MGNNIYLGLGTNLGNKIPNLNNAAREIDTDIKCSLIKCSSIYETSPCGFEDQENFFNAVVEITSDYSVEELFDFIKSVEIKLGRKDNIKWGPRIIDIDILLYNELAYSSDRITVPHKELLKRDFVIVPLLELNNDIVYPGTKEKISNSLVDFPDRHIISKLETKINFGESLA